MNGVRPAHIIVLAVVLVLLFGAKRLPDAARSLGRSLRIIKAETRGLAEDNVAAKAEAQATRQPITPDPAPITPSPVSDLRSPPTPVADPVQHVHDR